MTSLASDEHDLETAVTRVAALLLRRIGLRPDPGLHGRLRRAVLEGAQQTSQDFAAYVDGLAANTDTLQILLNRVTVQETAFFRHPQHFGVLARDVLPTLPQPVKIWSAGCSNGQEAYSLAMLLAEQGINGSVVATDLSTAALKRTAEARYRDRELSGLSPERRSAHLTRSGDSWEIVQPLRDRVTSFRHNLIDALPAAVANAQVIVCRNVLIYLSPEHARAFLDRIAERYPPQTTLFLGAAETIWQISEKLEAVPLGDTFVYRRKSPARPEPSPRSGDALPEWAEGRPLRHPAPAGSAATTAASLRPSADPDPREHPRRPEPAPDEADHVEAERAATAVVLAATAQKALEAGDNETAIVAFRKCAYLSPHDPLTQLHLGLALEASGHHSSARRAYRAARRALLDQVNGNAETAIKGFAPGELVRLLDSKLKVTTP
jgi:chemotaxis methyl-accepting protein methylase